MELTQERLHFLLHYKPSTGEFTWKVRRGGKANAGARSECIDSKGYYRIGIDGTRYLAHRLAWFYVHGEWPEGLIDHKNRVRTDNRINNLRVVSQTQNQWNISKSEAHDNPALGVSFDGTSPKRKSKWFAYITRNRKRIGLGHFMTKEEAILARVKAENEFNARVPKHTPIPVENHTPKVKA